MSSELERLLRDVRALDDPSPEDQARVLRAVHASIAAGVVSTVALSSSALPGAGVKSALAGALSVWKTTLGVVVVGGALAAGAGYAVLTSVESSDSTASRGMEQHDEVRRRAPAPVSDPAGARERQDEQERPIEQDSRAERGEPEQRNAVSSPATHPQPSAPPAPPSLQVELDLLREVQAALRRGAGQEALAKLDAHRTGDRQFLAERRAARILALCAVGRAEEARAEAARFFQEHPRSVQREAILESCANPDRGSKP